MLWRRDSDAFESELIAEMGWTPEQDMSLKPRDRRGVLVRIGRVRQPGAALHAQPRAILRA